MGSQYIRLAKFNLNEVLPFIGRGNSPRVYAGKTVKMNSLRYQVFKSSGVRCRKCGMKGIFFALEKDKCVEGDTGYHLNLYALSSEGEEILMTKDHILPKSRGGKDEISNLQTMCIRCNNEKGDKITGKRNYFLIKHKTGLITHETRKPRLSAADILIVFREHNGQAYFERVIYGNDGKKRNSGKSDTCSKRVPLNKRKENSEKLA